jgi:AcrR family transcriptional regulator
VSPLQPAPLRPRRTQAERTRTTRTALLEATIGALAEQGYARATTTEVCRRAGVSQGALFKHFATKAELVSAAAEHLFAALIGEYRASFAAVAAGAGDRIAAATRLLASTFQQPRLQAAFELYLAARTDRELAASLRPVADRHAANLREQARQLFPEAPASPAFESVLELVMSALQGAAIGGEALRDDARDERLLDTLTHLVRATFTTR